MSQNDSFIHEVTEEVRRERATRLFRRYGWVLVLAVLAVVLGAAGNEVLKSRAATRAEAAGDMLLAALAEADPAARAAKLAALDVAGGPAIVARLAEAAALTAAGNGMKAAEMLNAVAADPSTPGLIADLARVKAILAAGAEMPVADRLAVLDPMTAAGHPFRILALEQRALIRLETGDRDGAVGDLAVIAEAAEAGRSAQNRATQLLIALGGELPQAAVKVQ